MTDAEKFFVMLLVIVVFCLSLFFGGTTDGRAMVNHWRYGLQKVDDSTRYESLKKVEDTCRAMMASYTTDKLTYEQYKDSENAEKQGWAEQAKMRANKTAATYNEYIVKNTFVWKDNVPNDIYAKLEFVE